MFERRFIKTQEVRASGPRKSPKIQGYAATFNTTTKIDTRDGSFNESIRPGAFSRAIRESDDCVCLFNHSDMHVLGRTGAGTLRLKQDDCGLFYECDIPDTQAGRDTYTSIERGDINGCSFAFMVGDGDQEWEMDGDGTPCRSIRNVSTLIDVSPVTHPAYPSTSVSARQLAEVRSGKKLRKVVSAEEMNRLKNSQTSFEERIQQDLRNRRLSILDL
jgi:uncharacterized protein